MSFEIQETAVSTIEKVTLRSPDLFKVQWDTETADFKIHYFVFENCQSLLFLLLSPICIHLETKKLSVLSSGYKLEFMQLQ